MILLVLLLAYVVTLVALTLLLRSSSRRPALPSAALLASLLFFAAANLVNLCSPGWCEEFGFPLKYKGWSDAQLVMNGVNYGITPFNPKMLTVNVVVGLALSLVVFVGFRRLVHVPAV